MSTDSTSKPLDPKEILQLTTPLTKRVALSFSHEDLQKQYSVSLAKKARMARFSGFRKSHAPTNMVEKYYRSEILKEALARAAHIAISQYLTTHAQDEEIYASPRLVTQINEENQGNKFSFEAEYEIYPKIKALSISSTTVILPNPELDQEDLDAAIRHLRVRHTQYRPKKEGDTAQWGDNLLIAFKKKTEASETDQESPEPYHEDLILDPLGWIPHAPNDSFLASYELPFSQEGLLGLKKGETKLVPSLSSSDEGNPDLWEVTLLELSEGELPKLDGNWIKSLGIHPNNLENLKKILKEQVGFQCELFRKHLLKGIFTNLLSEKHPGLPVPRSLFYENLKMILSSRMKKGEKLEPNADEIRSAYFTSLSKLFLQYFIHRYQFKIYDYQLQAFLNQAEAMGIELPEDKMLRERTGKNYLLEEAAVKFLLDRVSLIEPPCTFKEFLAYAREGTLPASVQSWLNESGQGAGEEGHPLPNPNHAEAIKESEEIQEVASKPAEEVEKAPAKKKASTKKAASKAGSKGGAAHLKTPEASEEPAQLPKRATKSKAAEPKASTPKPRKAKKEEATPKEATTPAAKAEIKKPRKRSSTKKETPPRSE